MNDFIVQLIAKLDASQTPNDLKKIEQQLNKKGVQIKPVLNTATTKQEIQNLAVQMQKILESVGLNIDTSKITSVINKSIREQEANIKKLQQTSAKSQSQKEVENQNRVNSILNRQISAYREIQSINKQITGLNPTKDSGQIAALQEKKRIQQDIFLQTQKELSASKSIEINQMRLKAFAEERRKVESEIAVTQGKQADAAAQTAANQARAIASKSQTIGLSIDTGTYDAKVEGLIAKTQKWTDANGNARISTTNLQSALNNLNTAYANLTASGGNTEKNQRALIEAEKQLGIQIQDVTNKVRVMNSQFASDKSVQSLLQKYQTFYDKNTAAHGRWGTQLQSGIAELSSGKAIPLTRLKELETQYINIGNAARQAGKIGLSFFDKMKAGMSKFSYWTSSTFIIMKMIQEIREAVNFAKEFDSALANINYTMGVTESELNNIGQSSIQMAKDLKTSAEDVLGAVTLYANAKETADSILKKSEAALMLSNVTGMSGQESAKALQSVMNQFDLTQDDLMHISDTIQRVSQNMAYDFSKLVAA